MTFSSYGKSLERGKRRAELKDRIQNCFLDPWKCSSTVGHKGNVTLFHNSSPGCVIGF